MNVVLQRATDLTVHTYSIEKTVFIPYVRFIVLFIPYEEPECMKKRYIVMILSLITTVLLMSACSQPITGPTTGTGSSLTPLQVLQNSANAMQQLKSAHVEIQSTSSVQGINAAAGTPTATSAIGTPTITPTPTTSATGRGRRVSSRSARFASSAHARAAIPPASSSVRWGRASSATSSIPIARSATSSRTNACWS